MATQAVNVTGAVLSWARDQAGLSVEELARELTLAPEQIASWESEESHPTRGQVTKLAEILKRPSAVFLLTDAPSGASLAPSLRSAPGLGGAPLRSRDLRAIRQRQRVQTMLSWCISDRGDPPVDLPRLDTGIDAATAGEDARARSRIGLEEQMGWKNDGEAFRAWRAALERQGVFVQQSSLGRGGLRGFSVWDDHAPLVVVNSAYHPTARSFTLMHEFGHLLNGSAAACMHFVDPADAGRMAERWCERFAASYLVPAKALAEEAARHGITRSAPASEPGTVRRIANRFRVSGRAMAIRLTDVDLGVPELYGTFMAWMGQRDWNEGGGGSGEQRIEKRRRELGVQTIQTFLTAFESGRLNLRDLTDYLGLSPNEIDDLTAALAGE